MGSELIILVAFFVFATLIAFLAWIMLRESRQEPDCRFTELLPNYDLLSDYLLDKSYSSKRPFVTALKTTRKYTRLPKGAYGRD